MTPTAAVLSADCTHEDWAATAQVIRETDTDNGPVVAWSIELQMVCVACGAPMLWSGMQASSDAVWEARAGRAGGDPPGQPFVSPDRVTISLPGTPHPPGERS